MHRLIFTSALLLHTVLAGAQMWLEIGPRAGINVNGYLNSNIANDDAHDFSLEKALSYGLVAGINIGDHHGLNVEWMFADNIQKITYYGDTSGNVINKIKWKTREINVLYRFYSNGGAYVELGPKFSHVRELVQTYDNDPLPIDGEYEDNFISGVFGVGGFLAANEVMTLKIGLRAAYGLTDLVSAKGKEAGFPTYYAPYEAYKPTKPFRVGISLEMTFGVGGIAKTQCGQRSLIFGTRYRR
ncbi:MAG: hypothetical protein IPN33_01730 [Saprospiraceae bacterium]|nr:hypothetical protein [Saprospiraceae bacterium]